MQDASRQGKDAPGEQEPDPVAEQRERPPARPRRPLDLVVTEAEVAERTVVADDVLAEGLDAGLVLCGRVKGKGKTAAKSSDFVSCRLD